MANLKEIRTRIISVTNTRQVTSAMKMVSAAKLRKSQDAIAKIKPYAEKMQEIIESVGQYVADSFESPLFKNSSQGEVRVVLVTSNKGLCGVFNTSVIRKAVDWVKTERPQELKNNQVKFDTIGKKGFEVISKLNFQIAGRHDELVNKPTFEQTSDYTSQLIEGFLKGDIREVVVFYNRFKNVATQEPMKEKVLPITGPNALQTNDRQVQYILEPDADYIIEELAPMSLKIQIHKVILDSLASEHGARMTAMHKATDNASELIDTLRLNYNKARQDNITGEILEIVSGANALKG